MDLSVFLTKLQKLFLSQTADARLTKRCCLPCFPPPIFSPSLPPFLFWQVEFKMKKTEATRWEKLEGEGQESNIKHFNQSQSTHYCSSLHWSSSYFPPSKDQYGLPWLSAHAKARVGSGAPLEPFISLTVKVGSKDEGDDGKI